jgi:hypothetical protein
MIRSLAVLVVGLTACAPSSTDFCHDTVHVDIKLEGGTRNADTIRVVVSVVQSISGEKSFDQPRYGRTTAEETLDVEYGDSYSNGAVMRLKLTALSGNQQIGSGSGMQTLGDNCVSMAVTIMDAS